MGEGHGLGLARTVLESRGAVVEFRFLAQGEDVDPAALMEESLIAVRGLRRRGSVIVDITFGNKPMSVGLYEAAVEQGVNVGYQHRSEGVVTPQLILEERR